MICNIPCRITQHQLVEVIDAMGFAGKYDFLYLPTGGRSSTVGSSNLGYGFINFTDPGDTDPFMAAFKDFQFEGTTSTKVCTVRPAHIQGLENNILHFDRTAAKGRPRREGPFIRLPPKDPFKPAKYTAVFSQNRTEPYMEKPAKVNLGMQDMNSCMMQDSNLAWLEPSYFDFLEESSDFILGCA
jgi:hypothetical protein